MAEDKNYRPIKIVFPREEDFGKKPPGRGPKKLFEENFGPELIRKLHNDINEIYSYFEYGFSQWPSLPAVARVRLLPDAIAKSHRPSGFFRQSKCPIIGGRQHNELLIRITRSGLDRLSQRILAPRSHNAKASISTMTAIEPYRTEDALGPLGLSQLKGLLSGGLNKLKLRLFNHNDEYLNQAVLDCFKDLARNLDLKPELLSYPWGLKIVRLTQISPETVEQLARFIGTQGLSPFARIGVVETTAMSIRNASRKDFPPPQSGGDYPVVGVIDTGIRPGDPLLGPWLIGRETYVPNGKLSPEHGSFVVGLIVNPRGLNHGDPRFPQGGSKVLDVAAIEGGSISEDNLLDIIEEVLEKHPQVRTWNLSLSSADRLCTDFYFSDLAVKLDELQDRYQVTFILPSGNYVERPLRSWPAGGTGEAGRIGEADRITSPADSVRALTVGSLAHHSAPNACVNEDDPSPFSRRGPGPALIFKPEVVHFGGNCDASGQFAQLGVLSLDSRNRIAEDIGTSYSAPLVATTLANLQQDIVDDHSPNLYKALLVHGAALRQGDVQLDEVRYRGFGRPPDITRMVGCQPWEATFIFEDEIGGHRLDMLRMDNFPIPDCLRTVSGLVYGEFVMTLVYDPFLNPSYGAEYCRTHLEASLGVYTSGNSSDFRSRIPPVEGDLKKLYEREKISQAMKWYPVKVYHRNITRGIKGEQWSLRVSLLARDEFVLPRAQRFTLIVTIRDPKRIEPVYDRTMAALRQRSNWISQDLRVRERIRAQVL